MNSSLIPYCLWKEIGTISYELKLWSISDHSILFFHSDCYCQCNKTRFLMKTIEWLLLLRILRNTCSNTIEWLSNTLLWLWIGTSHSSGWSSESEEYNSSIVAIITDCLQTKDEYLKPIESGLLWVTF